MTTAPDEIRDAVQAHERRKRQRGDFQPRALKRSKRNLSPESEARRQAAHEQRERVRYGRWQARKFLAAVERADAKIARQQAPQSWRSWLGDVMGREVGQPHERKRHLAVDNGWQTPTLRRVVGGRLTQLARALGDEPEWSGPVSRLPDGPAPGTWGQWLCIDCREVTDSKPCRWCKGDLCVLGLVCSSCGIEDTIAPDLLGSRCSTCRRGTWVPDEAATVPR